MLLKADTIQILCRYTQYNKEETPHEPVEVGAERCAHANCSHITQTKRDLFVQTCSYLQTEKTLVKPVDKREKKCYNRQAVTEQGTDPNGTRKRITKKVEKTFAKPLDKSGWM